MHFEFIVTPCVQTKHAAADNLIDISQSLLTPSLQGFGFSKRGESKSVFHLFSRSAFNSSIAPICIVNESV